MANPTTPITRALNKTFKPSMPEGLRIQASVVGSFLSVRIDDPEGKVSVALADRIAREAGKLFREVDGTDDVQPMQGVNYHMGGVVINWRRK